MSARSDKRAEVAVNPMGLRVIFTALAKGPDKAPAGSIAA